jgi:hypothetical protein
VSGRAWLGVDAALVPFHVNKVVGGSLTTSSQGRYGIPALSLLPTPPSHEKTCTRQRDNPRCLVCFSSLPIPLVCDVAASTWMASTRRLSRTPSSSSSYPLLLRPVVVEASWPRWRGRARVGVHVAAVDAGWLCWHRAGRRRAGGWVSSSLASVDVARVDVVCVERAGGGRCGVCRASRRGSTWRVSSDPAGVDVARVERAGGGRCGRCREGWWWCGRKEGL